MIPRFQRFPRSWCEKSSFLGSDAGFLPCFPIVLTFFLSHFGVLEILLMCAGVYDGSEIPYPYAIDNFCRDPVGGSRKTVIFRYWREHLRFLASDCLT